MKQIVLITFALLLGLNTYAQRRDRMGNPVIQKEPTKEEIEKYKRQMEERKEEFITNFLTTLEADDFQKEIIKQYLNSYYDEKKKLMEVQYERSFDRQEAIKKLNESHFKELEELISENDMAKINDMLDGNFDEKEVLKEKRKKRKKKKKDKG